MSRSGRRARRATPEMLAPKAQKAKQVTPGRRAIPGETGPQGEPGATGPAGADGKSVKSIALTTDSAGKVTGGTVTLTDDSTVPITVTIATA